VTNPGRRPSRFHIRAALAIACAGLIAGFLAINLAASAQDQSAASDKDVIFARKALKDVICDKMAEIERMIALGRIDLDDVHARADAISVMLMAFPHLFPPSSNQWKPDADQDPATATLASPELWTQFPDFYRQAAAASKAAFDLSRAGTIDDVKTRARELRIDCDTCHALYLEDQ
jgi:cytochrome c556